MLWARARPRLFSASSLLHPAPPGAVAATPPAPLLRRPHRRVEAAPGNADSEAGGEAQSLPQGQRQLKQRQSALRQPLAEEEEYDEIHKLVQLLPPRVRERLEAHPQLLQLVEVVMDLGRPPLARFPSGDVRLSEDPVTQDDLALAVAQVGEFGGDNRAGIDKTLHRISCIRNRAGRVVGLTCRVGRAILGSAAMVDDLIRRNASILMLGRPGVGKTTAIREISRKLADEWQKRVVIVDTSNEIGGDGDIPHPGIGGARRMQVPHPDQQHRVMIEAVENHMPQVIVIDEIGTEAEALAARTIAQRGVQLIATAHGNELENIMKNPSLNDLVGGISSVTLGDEEAKRRGVQKSILERAAPPTFDVAVEMVSREQWRVHLDVGLAVDMLLAGQEPSAEVRERDADGRVWSWPEDIETDSEGEDAPQQPQGAQAAGGASQRQRQRQRQRGGSEQAAGGAPFIPEPVRLARSGVQDPLFGTYAGVLRDAKEATERLPKLLEQPTAADSGAEATAGTSSSSSNSSVSSTSSSGNSSGSSRAAAVGPFGAGASTSSGSSFAKGAVPQGGSGSSSGGTLRLFSYGVDAGSIWSVGSALRLEGRLELCDRLEEADAVLALRSRLKASAWVKEAARAAGIPVFSIKSAGVGDIVKALRTLVGIDPSPGGLFADGDDYVTADPRSRASNSRNSTPEASIALVAKASAAAGRRGARAGSGGSAAAAGQQAQRAKRQQEEAALQDAVEEARLGVEQIVIPRGQPIELLPRGAAALEAQIQLLLSYHLPFEVVGTASNQRLRVMPPDWAAGAAGGAQPALGSQQ